MERICKSWGVNVELGGQSWSGLDLLLAGLAARKKPFCVCYYGIQSQSLIAQGWIESGRDFKVIEVGRNMKSEAERSGT